MHKIKIYDENAAGMTPSAATKSSRTTHQQTMKKQAFGDLKNIIVTPSKFPIGKNAARSTPQTDLRRELLRKRHLELNETPHAQQVPNSPKPGDKKTLLPEEFHYFNCIDYSAAWGELKHEEIWSDMRTLSDDVFNYLLRSQDNDSEWGKNINLGSVLDPLENHDKPLEAMIEEEDEDLSLDPIEIPEIHISDDEWKQ